MSSVSFDRVADHYDATRGYPGSIAHKIAIAIDKSAQASAQTRFLEVGVGTGRIAVPLASLGHHYTGVDISQKMLAQLEAKLTGDGWQEVKQAWGSMPDEDRSHTVTVRHFTKRAEHASMRLIRSDITQLPFADASFDVIIAVHIFHLVDGWQQAVSEALRVLRPGGLLLHCWDEHAKSGLQEISEEWYRIIEELGGNAERPGAASNHNVTEVLQQHGLRSEQLEVVSWDSSVTARQVIENITRRLWSSTWSIPDDIFTPSAERLWVWANQRYGSELDTPRKQVRHFIISKTHV